MVFSKKNSNYFTGKNNIASQQQQTPTNSGIKRYASEKDNSALSSLRKALNLDKLFEPQDLPKITPNNPITILQSWVNSVIMNARINVSPGLELVSQFTGQTMFNFVIVVAFCSTVFAQATKSIGKLRSITIAGTADVLIISVVQAYCYVYSCCIVAEVIIHTKDLRFVDMIGNNVVNIPKWFINIIRNAISNQQYVAISIDNQTRYSNPAYIYQPKHKVARWLFVNEDGHVQNIVKIIVSFLPQAATTAPQIEEFVRFIMSDNYLTDPDQFGLGNAGNAKMNVKLNELRTNGCLPTLRLFDRDIYNNIIDFRCAFNAGRYCYALINRSTNPMVANIDFGFSLINLGSILPFGKVTNSDLVPNRPMSVSSNQSDVLTTAGAGNAFNELNCFINLDNDLAGQSELFNRFNSNAGFLVTKNPDNFNANLQLVLQWVFELRTPTVPCIGQPKHSKSASSAALPFKLSSKVAGRSIILTLIHETILPSKLLSKLISGTADPKSAGNDNPNLPKGKPDNDPITTKSIGGKDIIEKKDKPVIPTDPKVLDKMKSEISKDIVSEDPKVVEKAEADLNTLDTRKSQDDSTAAAVYNGLKSNKSNLPKVGIGLTAPKLLINRKKPSNKMVTSLAANDNSEALTRKQLKQLAKKARSQKRKDARAAELANIRAEKRSLSYSERKQLNPELRISAVERLLIQNAKDIDNSVAETMDRVKSKYGFTTEEYLSNKVTGNSVMAKKMSMLKLTTMNKWVFTLQVTNHKCLIRYKLDNPEFRNYVDLLPQIERVLRIVFLFPPIAIIDEKLIVKQLSYGPEDFSIFRELSTLKKLKQGITNELTINDLANSIEGWDEVEGLRMIKGRYNNKLTCNVNGYLTLLVFCENSYRCVPIGRTPEAASKLTTINIVSLEKGLSLQSQAKQRNKSYLLISYTDLSYLIVYEANYIKENVELGIRIHYSPIVYMILNSDLD